LVVIDAVILTYVSFSSAALTDLIFHQYFNVMKILTQMKFGFVPFPLVLSNQPDLVA
jgi:hypothetical protein